MFSYHQSIDPSQRIDTGPLRDYGTSQQEHFPLQQERVFLGHPSLAIAYMSLDCHWQQMSPGFCELVGYAQAELCQLTLRDLAYEGMVDQELSSRKEAACIHLRVQDQGRGIPQEALAEVFRPYNRIHATKTKYIQGTGLGLAIVYEIVKLHEGEVWVESVPGHGSVFHVTLPFPPS